MGVEAYTGTLADAGLQPLNGRAPEIFAELLHPAQSERYLLTTTPVKATLQGTGEFVFYLQPNDQIIGSSRYRVYARWLDGGREMERRDLWTFFARAGGGRIADMIDNEALFASASIWTGTDPGIPAAGRLGDVVLDTSNWDVSRLEDGGGVLKRTLIGNISGGPGPKGDKGDPGLPGTNGVATDTAVATNLGNVTSDSRKQLDKLTVKPAIPPGVLALTREGNRNQNAAAVLRSWYAGLAKTPGRPLVTAVIGDSWVDHVGATSWAQGWVSRFAEGLRREVLGTPVGGRGFMGISSQPLRDGHSITVGGNAAPASTDYGPGRQCLALATGWIEYVVVGDYVDIFYLRRPGGGTFRITVDGVDKGTINTNDTTQRDGGKHGIDLVTKGSHTIRITGVVDGAYVEGIDVSNGDKYSGIKVHALGKGGWTAAMYNAGAADPVGNWPGGLAALVPDILHVAVGTNDVGSVTAAQFQTNLHQYASKLRGFFPKVPIVFVAYGPPRYYESTYVDYANAMYNVAELIGNALVADLSVRMPLYDTDGTWANDNHLNDVGHRMAGGLVQAYLRLS